jgi:hypothetical protein
MAAMTGVGHYELSHSRCLPKGVDGTADSYRTQRFRACRLHGMRPTCDLRHVRFAPAFNTAGVRLLSASFGSTSEAF